MGLDNQLLALLVCPLCRGGLVYDTTDDVLICQTDQRAYPIEDGIPIMIEEKAKKLEGK